MTTTKPPGIGEARPAASIMRPTAVPFRSDAFLRKGEARQLKVIEVAASLGQGIGEFEVSKVGASLSSWLAWSQNATTHERLHVVLVGDGLPALDIAAPVAEAAAVRIGTTQANTTGNGLWDEVTSPTYGNAVACLVLLRPQTLLACAAAVSEMRRAGLGLMIVGGCDAALKGDLEQMFADAPLGVCEVELDAVEASEVKLCAAGDGPWRFKMRASKAVTVGQLVDGWFPADAAPPAKNLWTLDHLSRVAERFQQSLAREARDLQERKQFDVRTRNVEAEQAAARAELVRLSVLRAEFESATKQAVRDVDDRLRSYSAESRYEAFIRGYKTEIVARIKENAREKNPPLIKWRPRPHWSDGTAMTFMKPLLNKREQVELSVEALNEVETTWRKFVVNDIGAVVKPATGAFNDLLGSFEHLFARFGLSLKATHLPAWSDKTLMPQASGAAKSNDYVDRVRTECGRRIHTFCASQAATFEADTERKSFIGRLMEARSAVFGGVFLLMFFGRSLFSAVCSGEDGQNFCGGMNQSDLFFYGTYISLVFLVIALVVNQIATPRKESLILAEKIEKKLDEMGRAFESIATSLVRGFVGEVQEDLQRAIDTLSRRIERRQSALKARIERLGADAKSFQDTSVRTSSAARAGTFDLRALGRMHSEARSDLAAEYANWRG